MDIKRPRKRFRPVDDNPFNLSESLFDIATKKVRVEKCEDMIKRPSRYEKPDVLKCISDKLHSFYQEKDSLPTFMFDKVVGAPICIFSHEGLEKGIEHFGSEIGYWYISSYLAFIEHMDKVKLLRILEYIIFASTYFA